MASRAAALVAGIIDRIEGRPYRTGRPPLPTLEAVETLRFFAREGVQWRELRAAAGRACGPTPRRRLDEWSATALLRRVHVALIRTVRAGPGVAPWDVVVDSCPVRAERGGELTGPSPTDCATRSVREAGVACPSVFGSAPSHEPLRVIGQGTEDLISALALRQASIVGW